MTEIKTYRHTERTILPLLSSESYLKTFLKNGTKFTHKDQFTRHRERCSACENSYGKSSVNVWCWVQNSSLFTPPYVIHTHQFTLQWAVNWDFRHSWTSPFCVITSLVSPPTSRKCNTKNAGVPLYLCKTSVRKTSINRTSVRTDAPLRQSKKNTFSLAKLLQIQFVCLEVAKL